MVSSKKRVLIESLIRKGFSNDLVRAFEKIPREKFIPGESGEFSYEDIALPIGFEQTISQPSTIAFMLDLLDLKNNQKILEVGSGSGYVLCLISEISKNSEIFGVEKIKGLVTRSKEVLNDLGKEDIKVLKSSREIGLTKYIPFDRIIVSASASEMPKELISQLKNGGILVIPVKNSIFKIRKTKKGILEEEFHGFSFVPLV